MRRSLALFAVILLGTAALDSSLAGEGAVATAPATVVRGRATLADALRVPLAALPRDTGGTGSSARTPPVLLILDATPYTAAAEDALGDALTALDDDAPPAHWRLARLGEAPSPAVDRPGALRALLGAALATDTDVVATIPALRKTLKRLSEKGGLVVYLADWHFEDDVELEPFVKDLLHHGRRFSVIGSEACFGRAWTDGFYPPDRGHDDARGRRKMYADHVGRSPFGKEDALAPWHGGDSAWPHLPFRLRGTHWSTEFPVELPPPPVRRRAVERDRYGRPDGGEGEAEQEGERRPEDLLERQTEADEQALERFSFPLPSAFGSYPLMRAAAVTGGRYVLWSWNPAGRSDLAYDFGRCNLMAPDLRSRKTIFADLRKRPLARAILDAWHAVANEDVRMGDVTPPLSPNGRTPLEMLEASGDNYLHTSWATKAEHEDFLFQAERMRKAATKAMARLRDGLSAAPRDDVDRRYDADARLFLRILEEKHFQLGEALAAARGLRKDAWDALPLHPTLDPRAVIRAEREPRKVRVEGDTPAHDTESLTRLVEERRRFLERFCGTPFGELVARNRVNTYRVVWVGYADGETGRSSPSESEGEPGPGTPRHGGGSGGAGPTSGG